MPLASSTSRFSTSPATAPASKTGQAGKGGVGVIVGGGVAVAEGLGEDVGESVSGSVGCAVGDEEALGVKVGVGDGETCGSTTNSGQVTVAPSAQVAINPSP